MADEKAVYFVVCNSPDPEQAGIWECSMVAPIRWKVPGMPAFEWRQHVLTEAGTPWKLYADGTGQGDMSGWGAAVK